MRDKQRTRRRLAASNRSTAAYEPGTAAYEPGTAAYEPGTADWVLANEVGWGLPHGGVVFLAGIVVGARAVGWLIWRIADAVERALRERRDSPRRAPRSDRD